MNILILGSEGFIGSHAVKYFQSLQHKVTRADILLIQAPDYLLINPELADFTDIFIRQKFDICINASGAANVQLSFEHPQLDFSLNTANVFSMLDCIRRHNPTCRFLNFSSAAVYGNPESLPVNENVELKPLSPYGYHKMYSEQICREFYLFYNIQTINVRVFSAYGEGLKKQLFWDLYKRMEKAEGPIELFGTGSESRDFIYIQDLLSAIQCIIQRAEFNGSAINVASGTESTIEEAVRYFINAFDRKIDIRFSGAMKKGDPANWRADISLLKSIGYTNAYSLKHGIGNYCKWVQEKRSL